MACQAAALLAQGDSEDEENLFPLPTMSQPAEPPGQQQFYTHNDIIYITRLQGAPCNMSCCWKRKFTSLVSIDFHGHSAMHSLVYSLAAQSTAEQRWLPEMVQASATGE